MFPTFFVPRNMYVGPGAELVATVSTTAITRSPATTAIRKRSITPRGTRFSLASFFTVRLY
jgi:hypothetical protein